MKRTLLILAALLVPSWLPAQDTPPAPPEAVKHWRDARFGMFIHWGPVSLTGCEIGWSRGAETPVEEYDSLYKRFNPTQFNADEWVAVAKAAGMRYMVLTTKHHDGFCLWDTRETDYNIMNTPFKRDVVKELAEACKKGGIAFGTYYSTCDWYHADFPAGSPGGRTKKPSADLKAYDVYLQAQVAELLTRYGPLFTVWFDVPQSYGPEFGIPMVRKLRALQPDLMINNRAYNAKGSAHGVEHHNQVGDYDTPEQKIGGFQMERPWETCMTIGQQWSWKPGDKIKSLEQCLHTLIRTCGGDGNLLFNVGPEPGGKIEARQVLRLKEMGEWLAKNGESIYGTRGGPWKPSNSIASTRKGGKIYLHLLAKSRGPVTLPALPVAIQSARILHGGDIVHKTADGILSLGIPEGSWHAPDTIVELTVAGDSMEVPPLDSAPVGRARGTKP